MKKYLEWYMKWLSIWLGFLTILWLTWVAYWAYVAISSDVNPWDSLSASLFNNVLENQRVLKSDYETLNSTVTWLSNVPAWAVMAFNLSSCPTWWTAFTSGNGRVIVWVWSDWQWNNYWLINTWWEARHTLSVSEMPSHNHSVYDPWHNHAYYVYSIAWGTWPHSDNFSYQWNQWTFSTSTATTNISIYNNWWWQSHENRMPYLALLYCVKQ